MNSLNSETIEKQLFFLAKESVKYLVLNSKCGITISTNELKVKNIPNFDINIIKSFSPLYCIYKKGNAKLINIGGGLSLDEDALKKDVIIEGNAFMTLSLLELIDYYKKFKDIDNKKYSLSTLYLIIARKQLEFYAANLRNIEGVFVDKKNTTPDLTRDMKFEEKNKKFKYSDQAFLMAAYYKYSLYDEDKVGSEYRSFALDILSMFFEYRDELYKCSTEEILKLCLAFNLFYNYSKLDEAKLILLDLMEYIIEDDICESEIGEDSKIEHNNLLFLNCLLFYNNTGIIKFKDKAFKNYNKFIELYEPERGIYIKPSEKKEVEYNSSEIVLYLLSILNQRKIFGKSKDSNMLAVDIFRRQIVDSGVILSWPASPDLDDVERYKNFTSKSEDLLDEQTFRMSTLPTPDSIELAPVFIKNITYNKKKESFSQGKPSFDSTKNMFIFFLIIYLDKTLSELPNEDLEE
ncbi:hypothetical protein HMPREF1982_01247 [Clostridiales bacterium oral taxon 876 str. F0540]|nr:hypothetical protein HMPREF1982_01247 [Clostridiales bacterium oral taxon 876 str. F0540]